MAVSVSLDFGSPFVNLILTDFFITIRLVTCLKTMRISSFIVNCKYLFRIGDYIALIYLKEWPHLQSTLTIGLSVALQWHMTVLQPIAATFLHETVSMGEDHHHYSRDYPSLLMGILLLITIKPLHPFCLTCLDFFVGLPIVCFFFAWNFTIYVYCLSFICLCKYNVYPLLALFYSILEKNWINRCVFIRISVNYQP